MEWHELPKYNGIQVSQLIYPGLYSFTFKYLRVLYTQQNKLRVTQLIFPYVVYWVSSVAQTRQDIENRFSASLKGVKNEAFLIQNLEFKIFICNLSQICNFCQIFKNSCFIIFIDALSLRYQRYSALFIFDNVMHILLKVPLISIFMSMGSLNGKNCLQRVTPDFYQYFRL